MLTRGTALPARRHYGQEIVSTVLGEPVESPVVEQLWLKMYGDFVEALDGIDNGVAQYVTSEPPRYRSRTDLSSRVGNLNPRWNEPMTDDILIDGFNKATELCGSEFLARLDYLHKAWLPARDIVVRAVESRKDVHPSGKVIVFTEFCPWKVRLSLTLSQYLEAPQRSSTDPLLARPQEHLHVLEDELSIPKDELPLYVLYPESEKPDAKWRIQAVAVSPESFDSRKALPEACVVTLCLLERAPHLWASA